MLKPTPPSSSSETAHLARHATPPEEPRRRGSKLGVFLILVILAALTFLTVRMIQNRKAAAVPAKGGPGGGMPVPVVAGTVEKKDTPIYLNGIGTVQAFN